MRNRGIAIELTALLDVILIMMFMILVQSGKQVGQSNLAAKASATEANNLSAQLEATKNQSQLIMEENEKIKRMIRVRGVVEDNSCVITLRVGEAGEGRAIFVEVQDESVAQIELKWDNRNYAANSLHSVLSERIEKTDEQIIFIVFEYDRNNIYQLDYSLVTGAIQRQKRDARVYTAEYDIGSR